jgi:isopentenyl diphosphate isomerase/L-lactate dehydrogenase-like FMN-dependent dehydrogenase
VLLGRAYAYALAAAGEEGVARLIELLRVETDTTLGLMGETRIEGLHAKRDAVLRRG